MPNPGQSEMMEWLKTNTHSIDRVVVFGSYSRGEAYQSSDLDVLLIDSQFTGWNIETPDVLLGEEWPTDFQPLHVVKCSHTEFKKRYCGGDEMVLKIAENGFDVAETFGFHDYVRNIDCD